jgi:hypothetical protein
VFMAADHARRSDPSLAAKYHRLMTEAGKHHNSALCHVATALLTRIAACWRRGEHYQLTAPHGGNITREEARRIITEHYSISAETRAARRTVRPSSHGTRTGRRNKESLSAPSTGPTEHHPTSRSTA